MSETVASIEVIHNIAAHRFEVHLNGQLAKTQYHLSGDTITFIHTEVPPDFEGMGIASKMARAALDHARAAGLKVVPLCPYIAAYIRRHKEYQDLVAS